MTLISNFSYNGIPSLFNPITYLSKPITIPPTFNSSGPGYIGYWKANNQYYSGQIVLYIASSPPSGQNRFTFYMTQNNINSGLSPDIDVTNWICVFDTGLQSTSIDNGSSKTHVYGADPTIILSYFTRPQILQFIYDTLTNIPINFINTGSAATIYVASLGTLSLSASSFNTLILNQSSYNYAMTTGRSGTYNKYVNIINILWVVEQTIAVQVNRLVLQYNSNYQSYNDITQTPTWPNFQSSSQTNSYYY
jgi:hypothetical protein